MSCLLNEKSRGAGWGNWYNNKLLIQEIDATNIWLEIILNNNNIFVFVFALVFFFNYIKMILIS
jgi:hypothetical protein